MKLALFLVLIGWGLPVTAATEVAGTTPFVYSHYEEIFKRPPDLEHGKVRVWTIHQTPQLRVNLVELKGAMALHKHPDADHSMMVLEGKMRVQVGDARFLAHKGDFISIPKDTPHKYWPIGGKVRVVSMDAPYYDPAKVVKLE